jgi:hypothetical protein
MDEKVSAVLDESLVRRAKMESARQGKPFDSLLGEALEIYLGQRGTSLGKGEVAARSWAALRVDPQTLRDLLESEDGFLDA